MIAMVMRMEIIRNNLQQECDRLCAAAREKSKEIGIDISFAISDENGLLRITLVAGGYPLFVNEKIAGGIGVGGGTKEQDCQIAEYVVSVFEELVN